MYFLAVIVNFYNLVSIGSASVPSPTFEIVSQVEAESTRCKYMVWCLVHTRAITVCRIHISQLSCEGLPVYLVAIYWKMTHFGTMQQGQGSRSLRASLVLVDWWVRALRASVLVDRLSDCLSVQTIPLSGRMNRRSRYTPPLFVFIKKQEIKVRHDRVYPSDRKTQVWLPVTTWHQNSLFKLLRKNI